MPDIPPTDTPIHHRARLVPRGHDDQFQIRRTGYRKPRIGDVYVRLFAAPWPHLLGLVMFIYLATNIAFALAYLMIGNAIDNARPGSFMDAFFFSLQTMSTIGYGRMAPVGLAANAVVMVEVLTGFIFFAVTTGLVFSRFSHPTARVMFSDVAVICPYEGKPHLMLRLANERNNRIVDANIHMVILRKEVSKEGLAMRRFYDLPLVRDRVPILQLTWTLMHPIDESSPLYHATPQMLEDWDTEVIVSLTGLDETFAQTIHARQSYITQDIVFDAMFADIMKRNIEGNGIDIDYGLFHEVVPLKKG